MAGTAFGQSRGMAVHDLVTRFANSLALAIVLTLAGADAPLTGGSQTPATAQLAPGSVAAARSASAMESPAGQVLVLRLASIPQPNWTSGHRGVDLAMKGTRVVSPASGTVTFAGWVVNRPVISIAHGDGLVTSIEPVTATVPVGSTVRKGQVVGEIAEARPHCTRRACIHWGLRLNGAYVDPLDYLEGFGEVRLLPWWRA